MNGGTVKNVFGGGLHQSSVTNAEVIINNDNGIIQGEILITLENGETARIGTGIIQS